ncbi:MAG: hypothetical protein M3Q58_01000 [Bacteroidota bacterium]|nr:hypothetical protein [Bacteroidota bacterium]
MENIDLKTIIYFVIAILWFLYSTFRKSQKKKNQAEALPPLKDQDIKEILNENVEQRRYKEDARFDEKSQLKKFKEKKKAAFVPVSEKSPAPKIDQEYSDNGRLNDVLAGVDPRDMVIYSEILKRPVY